MKSLCFLVFLCCIAISWGQNDGWFYEMRRGRCTGERLAKEDVVKPGSPNTVKTTTFTWDGSNTYRINCVEVKNHMDTRDGASVRIVQGGPGSSSVILKMQTQMGSLTFLAAGASGVWSSPVIPMLQSNNSNINPIENPVSNYDISLIAGLFLMGSVITPLVVGIIMDTIGRKNTLLLFGTINTISHIALSFARTMIWLVASRFINGICLGAVIIALPVFLSEITDDHNRAKFGCLMNLFFPLGQLYGYTVGYFLSYSYFSLACAVPVVLHIILFLFVLESPVYLLKKVSRIAALESLGKYKGNKSASELEKDIKEMEDTMDYSGEDGEKSMLFLFTDSTSRRGFIIGLGIVLIPSFTGNVVISFFMGLIFEEAHTGFPSNMAGIFSGLIQVITFFFVSQIIEELGRKPLLFSSTALCSFSLFFLGLYFFLKDQNYGSHQTYWWLPLVSILFYVLSYSVGLGPIPLGIIGELFDIEIRSTAVSLIIFLVSVVNTALVSLFPIVNSYIGICGCIWFFCGSSALGVVFIYFMVPETGGKSIHEIQEILRRIGNRNKL